MNTVISERGRSESESQRLCAETSPAQLRRPPLGSPSDASRPRAPLKPGGGGAKVIIGCGRSRSTTVRCAWGSMAWWRCRWWREGSSVEHRNLKKKDLLGHFPAVSGVEARVRRGRGGRGGLARPDLLDRARARGSVISAGEGAGSVACRLCKRWAVLLDGLQRQHAEQRRVEVSAETLAASSRVNAGRARHHHRSQIACVMVAGADGSACAFACSAALACAYDSDSS